MESVDVAIVGGGPAGTACAWRLAHHAMQTLVLDRAVFPRLKLCAGWITPQVIDDLALDMSTYPYSFMTFQHIHAHVKGFGFKLGSLQHSIRRCEFDHYLLERCGATVRNHYVRDVRRVHGHYEIDGRYRARFVVGAAGTKCPVYKAFFRAANPRAHALQTVTYEHEFPYAWDDGECHLWFFERGLPGYAWYVPKSNAHLNVGIGAMAGRLKRRGGDIKDHWRRFTERLADEGLVRNIAWEPAGYSYYLRGNVETVRIDDAFIVGDSVGLATRDLCEGIGPAVRSGILAAEAIATGAAYSLEGIERYSADNSIVRKLLELSISGWVH